MSFEGPSGRHNALWGLWFPKESVCDSLLLSIKGGVGLQDT